MKTIHRLWVYLIFTALIIALALVNSCKKDEKPEPAFTKKRSMENIFNAFKTVGDKYNFKLVNNPVIFCNQDFELVGYCTQDAALQTRATTTEGMPLMLFYFKSDVLPADFYKLVVGKTGTLEIYGGENFTELLNTIKNDLIFTNNTPIALKYLMKCSLDTNTGKAHVEFGTYNLVAQNRGTFAVSGKSDAKYYFPDQIKTVGDELSGQLQFYETKLNEGLPDHKATQYKETFVYVYQGTISLFQMAQIDLVNLEYKNLIKGKEYAVLTGYIDKENDSSHHFITSLETKDQTQWCIIRNRTSKKALITEQTIRTIPAPNPVQRMTISYEHDVWTDGAGHTSSYTYSNFHFDGIHIDKFKSDCWWEHD